MPHVVVVGGGLAGLATAFRVRRAVPAATVTVLEPNPRPGGNVGTDTRDGFRVERGPNGFLDNKPGMVRLCRDVGLGERLVAASEGSRTNRFVFVGETLHKLPRGPLGLLTTPLLSARGKWGLFTEPFRRPPRKPPADESVRAFVTRRAGREAADVFADAMVTGIHAGDPAQLSVAAAFPRLPVIERQHGSLVRGFLRAAKQRKRDAAAKGDPPPGPTRMWSFHEGLGLLVDTLAEQLGGAVVTGVTVRRVERDGPRWVVRGDGADRWSADAIVLTAPSYAQADMLADLDPALAADVAAIGYNRIAVVAVGYRQADTPGPLDGFGYIAPQNTRRDILGVQWCSSIFPDRAPPGFVLWRALCGGVHRGDAVDWPDDKLVKAVHAEIALAQGVTGDPVFAQVVRWPRAIPQYVLGHPARVARIEAATARHGGLFLSGNAYRGVAMNDVAGDASLVADRVADWLRHETRDTRHETKHI